MQPADTRPLTRRETEVRRFVRARFGLRGTLNLHHHALGLDLLRAPVNVMLSPVFLLSRLLAALMRRLGMARAADWLGRRQDLMPRRQRPQCGNREIGCAHEDDAHSLLSCCWARHRPSPAGAKPRMNRVTSLVARAVAAGSNSSGDSDERSLWSKPWSMPG